MEKINNRVWGATNNIAWISLRGMRENIHRKAVVLCVLELLFLPFNPALGDVDLSGSWGQKIHEDFEERVVGPAIGDYSGIPLNTAARLRAQSWDDAHWSVPEHQCEAAPADYAPHAPGSMRVWSEVDLKTQQLIAWHVVYLWHAPHRVIWMDGRRHPPEGAPHTWMGFSTGKWVGDTLVVTTTHLKEGWIRRNGVPRSDLGMLTEYWMRHGSYLTVASVVEDPVYLTTPFIRSSTWALNLGYEIGGYLCSPKVESDLPRGFVAHQLPGKNTALREFAAKRKLPPQAADGGEETIYPEYARKLAGQAVSAPVEIGRESKVPRRHSQVRQKLNGPPIDEEATLVMPTNSRDVQVLSVRDSIFVLMSSVGNTTVQIGDDGILIVDPQRVELSATILNELRKLSAKPIRNIINTSADVDNTGGNESIAKAGRSIGPDAAFRATEETRASIYAHENVLRAMSARVNGKSDRESEAWPTDVYFTASTQLYFNSEAVELLHVPAAHTNGDSVVYFRRSDVLSAGNVLSTTSYPYFDSTKGGSINGVIEALNRIVDITVPESREEGGTLVIPGRGRICDEYEVVAYRDMITVIRDRIQDSIHKGLTLQQVQASQPTQAYDGRYGAERGPLTTKRFVEAVYQSLTSGAGT